MSAFSFRRPAKAGRAVLASFVAGAAGLSAGGCANTHANYSASGSPATYVAQGPSVPMESDGLPVQAPPSTQIRQLPDDPTQPFSPNYGGANPASKTAPPPTAGAANDVPASKAAIPHDLPPNFRRQLVVAVNGAG